VHLLRANHDAIMVGVGTALSDDPLLNVRLTGLEDRSPVRIILDSNLRLPLTSKLVNTARQIPLWIIGADDAPVSNEDNLRSHGAEVIRVKRHEAGGLDLDQVLQLLATSGITRVFSEGGPRVAEDLVKRKLVDSVIISTADHALGLSGVVAIRPALASALRDAARFVLCDTTRYGTDVFKSYERQT
jgi:diaminohydroxyphosphoribosylaminopyrimidine deaminase / 5-amino-6-(5-phosphoribosylamino)uracil reductase